MSISKITPILIVESVEASLPFWQLQLGYEVVHTVPHGESIGFVILKQAESEVMLQSAASAKDDLKIRESAQAGSVLLYADVDSVEKVIEANRDGKVLIASRKTDYGALEAWIKTPSGTIMGFAEFPKK